jgi:hypothetical protein
MVLYNGLRQRHERSIAIISISRDQLDYGAVGTDSPRP